MSDNIYYVIIKSDQTIGLTELMYFVEYWTRAGRCYDARRLPVGFRPTYAACEMY
jgi:hypothetical protein